VTFFAATMFGESCGTLGAATRNLGVVRHAAGCAVQSDMTDCLKSPYLGQLNILLFGAKVWVKRQSRLDSYYFNVDTDIVHANAKMVSPVDS